jgi:hypothetical protein
MAHLWIQGDAGWDAKRLTGRQIAIAASEASRLAVAGPLAGRVGDEAAWLISADAGGSPVWALVASQRSGVRINGRVPPAGLCVLAERDEIRIEGGPRFYFSRELLATVEEFPGAERTVFCGRCRQPIGVGTPAVCCPNCGIWYHQTAEFPCWIYAETCSCGKPTDLDAGFSWVPEED